MGQSSVYAVKRLIRARVHLGAELVDAFLPDESGKDPWFVKLLIHPEGKWLSMKDDGFNIFCYLGEFLDTQRNFECFGFTNWRELYDFGMWPEGCFPEEVDEEEVLRQDWYKECHWRNAGKPAQKRPRKREALTGKVDIYSPHIQEIISKLLRGLHT